MSNPCLSSSGTRMLCGTVYFVYISIFKSRSNSHISQKPHYPLILLQFKDRTLSLPNSLHRYQQTVLCHILFLLLALKSCCRELSAPQAIELSASIPARWGFPPSPRNDERFIYSGPKYSELQLTWESFPFTTGKRSLQDMNVWFMNICTP